MKNRFRIYALVIAGPLLFAACNKKAESTRKIEDKNYTKGEMVNTNAKKEIVDNKAMNYDMAMTEGSTSGENIPINPNINPDMNAVERKLSKNGQISLTADDISGMENKIDEIAKKYKGYIYSLDQTSRNNFRQINAVIKVEETSFDLAIEDLKALGKVNSSSFSVDDLTLQFVDTETRLNTLKAMEQRLMDLLNKATRVEDLITIESQLQSTRQQIEYTQSSLNILKNQVSYSTINITISDYKSVDQNPPQGFFERLGTNLREGLNYFTNALINLINLIAFSLPILIPLAIIFFIIRRLNIKKRREIKERNQKIVAKKQIIEEALTSPTNNINNNDEVKDDDKKK